MKDMNQQAFDIFYSDKWNDGRKRRNRIGDVGIRDASSSHGKRRVRFVFEREVANKILGGMPCIKFLVLDNKVYFRGAPAGCGYKMQGKQGNSRDFSAFCDEIDLLLAHQNDFRVDLNREAGLYFIDLDKCVV